MKKATRSFKYYSLLFLSLLISFIGLIGMRMIVVGIGIGIAHMLDRYIGSWSLTIGWIVGLFIAAILLIGFQSLLPYLEKLDNYTNTYKSFPYTEKYGRNFPQPKPEDFGITQDEFNEYNRRFQFELTKLIFTYGLWIATCIYTIAEKIRFIEGSLLMGGAVMVAILLNYLFEYWNKRISQSHRYYKKIKLYQDALGIYFKIRNENLEI